MDEAILALMIPIVAIVMGCSIPLLLFLLEYLKKKHLYEAIHKERVAAIDKGLDLPPWPEGLFRVQEQFPHPRRYLRRGLVWLFVGIGLAISLYFGMRTSSRFTVFAVVPIAIGIAHLIYYRIEGARETADWEKAKQQENRRERESQPV